MTHASVLSWLKYVFQLMCLADLELDFINLYDLATRINKVVMLEFLALCWILTWNPWDLIICRLLTIIIGWVTIVLTDTAYCKECLDIFLCTVYLLYNSYSSSGPHLYSKKSSWQISDMVWMSHREVEIYKWLVLFIYMFFLPIDMNCISIFVKKKVLV